jgi:hypothetical protein
MQSMSDKELDQLFKSRFDSFEAEPSASLWSAVESQLESKPRKRAVMPVFWMAAASVVVLLGAGLWLFKPEEKVYLKGKTRIAKLQPAPVKAAPDEASVATIEARPEAAAVTAPAMSTVKVTKPLTELASDNARKEISYESLKQEPVAMPKEEQPAIERNVMAAVVSDEERPHSRRGEVHQTVLAMLPEEKSGFEQPLQERRKIRSVGDLVNFVVARVDQREDKLIELSDDDEGTRISGINLGLFKIKGKKRQ